MRWIRAVPLVLVALGLGGCMCSLSEPDEGSGQGCVIGMQCPDGTCVLNLLGGIEDPCCGFGGECQPCGGPWQGGFECPDGTCAWSAEACCYQGGACDPSDTDGPPPASSSDDSTAGDSTASDTGDPSTDTGDPSTDTGDPSSGSSDEGTTGSTDTGEGTQASSSTSDTVGSSTG